MSGTAQPVVRPYAAADLAAIVALVGRLGAWFDERGRRHIPIDLGFQRKV